MKKHRLLRLLLVMAMFASPFVADIANAEPADAGWACDSGWQLTSNNMCSKRVYKATYGCAAGWNSYNGSQCYRSQQHCPAGGYLSGGRCNVYLWGSWGQYTPSTYRMFQPKTTSYRWVSEWRSARFVATSNPPMTSVGSISNSIPPANNSATLYPSNCQPRMVSTFEKASSFINSRSITDFHTIEFVRTYTVIDQVNMASGCTSNGGTEYHYSILKRKTGSALCTAKYYGGQVTCGSVGQWRYAADGQPEPGWN